MKSMEGTKYVSKTKGGYLVSKRINGKSTALGFYKTIIGALMIRDWCMANDWKKYPRKPKTEWKSGYKRVDYCIYEYTGISKKTYRINKVINQETIDYGSYDSLEKAKFVRDCLIKNGWRRLPNKPTRHIKKKPQGNYTIIKWLDGKSCSFGSFDCLTDAMAERDRLVELDWDIDAWCDLG